MTGKAKRVITRMVRRVKRPVYPIHGYTLGYCSTRREPFTIFRCTGCGRTTIGSAYELPNSGCYADDRHETEWVPTTRDTALATLREQESDDIVAGTQTT
jgi:hypothetical protein